MTALLQSSALLAGNFLTDYHTIVHIDDALAKIKNAGIVRDYQHSAIGPDDHPANQFHSPTSRFRIEGCRRFIAYQEAWLMHQGTSNGHPLLLTSGQLVRISVHPIGHA
jgi:hypothetical protein